MLHTLFASFSEPTRLSSHQGLVYLPLGFTLKGYKMVFANSRIWNGYYNTIIYVVGSVALGIILTLISGYTLFRKNLYFRNHLMFFVAFTMMFNGGIISFYMVVMNLNMIDTRWAIIIPGCVNAFFLQDRSLYPLQWTLRDILLRNDMANMSSRENMETSVSLARELIKYCTTVVATVPILLIYPFVQKYFVKGVMIGSIKG